MFTVFGSQKCESPSVLIKLLNAVEETEILPRRRPACYLSALRGTSISVPHSVARRSVTQSARARSGRAPHVTQHVYESTQWVASEEHLSRLYPQEHKLPLSLSPSLTTHTHTLAQSVCTHISFAAGGLVEAQGCQWTSKWTQGIGTGCSLRLCELR